MRRMGAEDERGLEENLVYLPGASSVVREPRVATALRALGVLVAEAEPQELRRHEAQIGLHRPLLPGIDRVLCPVVPESGRPAAERADAERLHLSVRVPSAPLPGPFLLHRGFGVRVRHQDLANA